MAKIQLVHYAPEHLSQIKLKAVYEGEAPRGDVAGALTFMHEGKPIAIFGGSFVSRGVFRVWGLISEDVKKIPLTFHKAVKLTIQHWAERLNLHRVEMSVMVGFMEGWKWAVSLGFACEGVMRQYGPQRGDYWLFARVTV